MIATEPAGLRFFVRYDFSRAAVHEVASRSGKIGPRPVRVPAVALMRPQDRTGEAFPTDGITLQTGSAEADGHRCTPLRPFTLRCAL